MKRYKITISAQLILAIFSILAACNTSSLALDHAERQWDSQGISSYRIEVFVVNSIWHAQSHSIIVQNGEVVEKSARCIPAPFEGGSCEVAPFVAEDFTIPGLFAKARSESQGKNTASLKITFEPTYGYPDHISFNDPEILDEDWSWAVTSFEILSP